MTGRYSAIVSVAGVELANGLIADYLRSWIKEHREQPREARGRAAYALYEGIPAQNTLIEHIASLCNWC